MEDGTIRRRRHVMASAAVLLAIAAALAAGCSGDDGKRAETAGTTPAPCSAPRSDARELVLCVSATEIAPGQGFAAWLAGSPAATRGLDATLEAWRDGAWHTAARLVAALPHGDGEPAYALGDAPIAVRGIGIAPAQRLRYVMPPVPPGRYRVTQDVSVEDGAGELRRATVDRELAVVR